MLQCESKIHLFSDHRNLLFVYNPMAMEPALGRHIVTKVQRWALFLSRFNYTIEHIPGKSNVMADIMTRWYGGYRGPKKVKRIGPIMSQRDIVESTEDPEFIWPTMNDICESQKTFKNEMPKNCALGSQGERELNGKIWIPSSDSELQMKLIVVAHCGKAGHRGSDSTLSAVQSMFVWKEMRQDVEMFVRNCIHCMIGKGGNRIPRPYSCSVHAMKPNEVLHFDYLYMGASSKGLKYVLVLKDDLSSYVWLSPFESPNQDNVTTEISRWIRVFTVMRVWISDQASHFKNEVMSALANEHRINHSFVVAYSPWANGTVESCMRHIRAACTALLSKWKLAPQDWPTVIGVVMTALNESPLKRLGKNNDGSFRCPLEVMTGLSPSRSFLKPDVDADCSTATPLETIRVRQMVRIGSLQASIENMHKDVHEKVTRNRLRHIERHNADTRVNSSTFDVGDFVLVRRAQNKGHKLSFRWKGPRTSD